MLTRLAIGRASRARSRGVSRATLASRDLVARRRVIDLVRRLVIRGIVGSVCFRCLSRVVVTVPQGCGVDRSNVRDGGDLTFLGISLPVF